MGRSDTWIAVGLVCAALAAYVLTGPGRLDMTDGQWRFEVARGLVDEGRPVVRDPLLRRSAITGRDGQGYSAYCFAGSVAGVPLVWLGDLLSEEPDGELQRFLYSHLSAIFGALLLAVLYLAYRALRVERVAAVRWTVVAGFATLIWPLAVSSFDQVHHALLVTLSLLLAMLSAQRHSVALAATAGATAGLLLGYQEIFVIFFPALAVAVLADPAQGDDGEDRRRMLVFMLAAGIGVALALGYNHVRFGSLLETGKLARLAGHPPLTGNALVGLWGLLLSPGKSVFLYSPPIILSLVGLRGLCRRQPRLAQAIGLFCASHLILFSSLSFWSGEWSWGPRYMVLVVAPLALAWPFLPRHRLRRPLVAACVGAGLVVQLLAVSLDHQRFFFERQLSAYFWGSDSGFYLRESQLLARPGEILRSLVDGMPAAAESFQPSPYPELLTYCMFGSREVFTDPHWVRRFQVFHLPRPWPLWMPRVDQNRYRLPVDVGASVAGLLALGLVGVVSVLIGLRPREMPPGGAR
jgi:hypothetical protein